MTALLCVTVFGLNAGWAAMTVWMWGTGEHVCGHTVGWLDWGTTLLTFVMPMVLAVHAMVQHHTIKRLQASNQEELTS